jgi:hypothetical protein
VALNMIDVPLVLLVLGLVAGLALTDERMVVNVALVIALPLVGAALAHIPTIGAQLNAVMGNLQLGIAGAATSALTIMLYGLVMEGVTGLTAAPAPARVATTY